MSADFDLESALFLLSFRRLSAEQQRLVEWMIHNIGTLDKLLSAGDTPVGALSALRDGALERGDDLLALLAAYALFQRQLDRPPEKNGG